MIKKLNNIKPKKQQDPKVMCNKIEALKVKCSDQAEVLDNNRIVMHLFLVCPKLYKLKLTQAQVEAKVNDTDIRYAPFLGVCKDVQIEINTSSN